MTKRQAVIHGRKFAQVVEGAARIFLRDGYAGASVDDIAEASWVSKATLYSYFPQKQRMFEEAMRARIAGLAGQCPLDVPEGATARQALPLLARQIVQWLTAPANLRLQRLHIAEATRFPAQAKACHAMMATVLHDPLRVLLEGWTAQGQLRVEDSALAADQFIRLAGAGIHDAALMGVALPPADEIARIADSAAAMFLACYATGQSGGMPMRNSGAARPGIRPAAR